MKKVNFLSKILLGILLLNQLLCAENFSKIVLSSHMNQSDSNNGYMKINSIIEKKHKKLKEKYGFEVTKRASEKYFISVIEPLSLKNAKEILKELKADFPTAFLGAIQKSVTKEKESNSTYNLNEMLKEIINTDSEIKERLSQYNATVEEIGLSEAGYYPKIDFLAKVGRKAKEEEGSAKDTFNHNEVTVKLIQNIFDGFGTTHAVKRDQARARAAYNKYLEVAQDKMYRGIESYLKVLRYTEVLNISKDNVKLHEETLLKIQERYDTGFSTLSEVERVKGRLSLAKSNYISETNNLVDAKINFHKALGRYVDEEKLIQPEFKQKLPKTLEHAQDIAIHNNPSILVANEDIIVGQEALQYAKKANYPTLDIELSASRYNDLTSSNDNTEEEQNAMLVLNYNLYNGGFDKAEKQKRVSLLNYEYERKTTLKREVQESLALSWSANKMVAEQYKYQIQYRDLTQKTQLAYQEEFQLGRRTLIDLLDVQDEVNHIKINVIHTTYDLLFSKYRIIDALGDLYKVFENELNDEYKKDEIRAYVDQDNDTILDCEDLCDNSQKKETNLYGCEGIQCIQIDEIKFDKEIKENQTKEVQVDTKSIEKLWNANR